MADLREVVAALGHADVATYIQSGNVLFTPASGDPAALATGLEQAVAAKLGVQCGVIVLSRDDLARVAADNPYPDEPDPRAVHVIFLPAGPAAGHAEHLAEMQRQA